MERIILPLDGTREAEAVLPPLRALLHRRPAEIVLVRAAWQLPTGRVMPGFELDPGPMWTRVETDAADYLQGVSEVLSREGMSVRFFVRVDPPARSIIEAVLTEEATLVAMATHGRGGALRLLLGSVTEDVVRRSPVPVFVTRIGAPPRESVLARILAPMMRRSPVPLLVSRVAVPARAAARAPVGIA